MKISFWIILCLTIGAVLIAACGDQNAASQREPLSEKEVVNYSLRGQAISAAVFSELRGQLMNAIKEGGVPAAIKYCNIAALQITDSLSRREDVRIQRIADRFRNPKNSPNVWQAEVMEAYREQLKEGKNLSPEIRQTEDGSIVYMSPIFMQSLCLKCHGEPEKDIAQETLQAIQQFYPEDRAKGFAEGDLRGIWSIRFAK